MSRVEKGGRLRFSGFPGSPGVALGRPVILLRSDPLEHQEEVHLQPQEKKVAVAMWKKATTTLNLSYQELEAASGKREVREILETQRMILMDPELHRQVETAIRDDALSLPFAIYRAVKKYTDRLMDSGVDWAEERAVDVISVRNDLLRAVRGEHGAKPLIGDVIVFTDEIAPVEMITMSRTSLKGLVLRHAGRTSHAVILAKSLGLPCVTGVDWRSKGLDEHQWVMINGEKGEIVCSPDGKSLEDITGHETGVRSDSDRLHQDREFSFQKSMKTENRMACGHPFVLRANVESLLEMDRVQAVGAMGVGLFRTESMILQERMMPVSQQEQRYRKLLKEAGDQPVTIRLLDAGGDKAVLPEQKTAGTDVADEEFRYREANPFLGCRGVRMLTDRPELLNDQLEAILRASAAARGKVSILVPMVTFLDEILDVKKALEGVMSNLRIRNIPFDEQIRLGIMIEVPAMALQASEAVPLVDFMSIGTNDLIQYTLAVDRGNEYISEMYEASHPAVWRLMQIIADQVQNSGIPVHVCGEMASDPVFAAAFLGMGMQELSMGSASLPAVRAHLQQIHRFEASALAESLVKSGSVHESKKIIRQWQKKYL